MKKDAALDLLAIIFAVFLLAVMVALIVEAIA